ncbi:penicillin acylase family protein [Granulicella tundricola]|uniref:Peptidase S45 penicillin amidase n=1 Tax=Granulicella tundricola (strain ATCC BAA-1859 / DSM 23138 / MP5ACTX9) TaxID=1198114 RepID=E8WZA3_GRATM|nr:penicillin acylase family protein [Granulicella tundricola]ADW67705.1 peptidase S45 penicillin amidase [Granulicella tundricola MP5ACTX9]
MNQGSRLALLALIAALTLPAGAAVPNREEQARWSREAAAVQIVRDDWGIAHVHGKTDADAVFGMIYAQAEDDFNRVESNYLDSLGRRAESEGESKIYQDLRQKLFIDPEALKKEYAASPQWLQQLMNAWADGLNFYLAKHPEVKPKVIQRFEPWMALSFTEGSIGGDIERVDLKKLEAFYTHKPLVAEVVNPKEEPEPKGSNGFAIAPSNSASHHALLWINPHTSFFFRSELQMTSDQGLNAYGAVTWGQIFIYQGFNDRAGWMHTSSNVDAVDEYLESIHGTEGHYTYIYAGTEHPVTQRQITVPYATPQGPAQKTFTALYTSHGPIIREENGKWVSIQLMQEHIKALEQSYTRTKARNYQQYLQTMELKANSSNNTIFADADGDIAYWHGNYIPRRDPRFNYTHPVDGTDPATDWHGLLTVAETPHLLNPASGFLFNVNNWPWAGAGSSSLHQKDYPAYVEQGTETPRGLHAIRVLDGKTGFTPASLIAAAFDSYLPWFDKPIPALQAAWSALPPTDPTKSKLALQVETLRDWNHRWSSDSFATSLAVYWAEEVRAKLTPAARKAGLSVEEYSTTPAAAPILIAALNNASTQLTTDFGTWKTPWGDINRFQRLDGQIIQPFNDAKPSQAVPFTSSLWGSLASFGAKTYPGTKKRYGTNGNSFVAVVEFGDKIRARAVTAGGESGHPESKHFDDEVSRYITGDLRDIYFYPDQLKGHTERTYRPGE